MSTLNIAIDALKQVSDPACGSLRRRDPNCVRYIASEALEELAGLGVDVGDFVRWVKYDTAGGNIAGEIESL